MKNIYLIGMMGSGKTTTGAELAKLLSVPFVDLDERIVEHAGCSINEIFKTEGEAYFRNIESKLLFEVSRAPNQVVATGGGIVINPANCERMKSAGFIIYLKTGLEVLWKRVQGKKDRPLLAAANPMRALEDLYQSRTPLYAENAQKTFVTDLKTPYAVALEIYKTCFEK